MCQSALTNYVVPAFYDGLAYNFVGGQYVSTDFGPRLQSQILPMAGSIESQQYLMEVLKCSAVSPCINASSALLFPNDRTNMKLEDSYLDFTVALYAQMTIDFAGKKYFYQESADINALKDFLDNTVMGAYRGTAKIQRNVAAGTGFVQYHIDFPDLYSKPAPHFSAPYEGEASFFSSVETSWRFVISSTKSDLYGAMKWWLEWLKTNGNAVAIQHPSLSTLKVTTIIGPGSPFSISSPKFVGIAADQDNFVYLGDVSRVFRFTEGENASVYAGSATTGYLGGDRSTALFSLTRRLATDYSGNLYLSDEGNYRSTHP
uniref:Uncharacterized protein n=1 Tax=Globisporangium ultimum (strain ATCC 200006 / CBS 805.95 / DAOM BR144) TaxID=431595 RepID=K3WXU1_GLOUD